MLFVTISTVLFGLPKSLFKMFERQDVEGSDALVDYKTLKDKTKLVRKKILDTSMEGTSPQSTKTQNNRNLEAFDLESFW